MTTEPSRRRRAYVDALGVTPARRLVPRISTSSEDANLFTGALSAKRTNKALAGFVSHLAAAGKPPKVILVAVARKLLIYAHAVIRTRKPFHSFPNAPSPA